MTYDELVVYSALSKNINNAISEIMSAPGIRFGKSKVTELLKAMSGKGIILVDKARKAQNVEAI